MKFKSILVAALAAVVAFSSCSKEESGDYNTSFAEEGDAQLSLSFQLPSTRAEGEATTEESTPETVSLYVFAADGTMVNHEKYTISADFELKDGAHKLKDAVTTKAGKKTIYIGINVPADYDVDCDEEVLKTKAAELAEITVDNKFTMFGSTVKTLEPIGEGETKVENNVAIDVERVSAKINVTTTATDNKITKNFTTDGEVTIAYELKGYALVQVPKKTYLVAGETTYSLVNSFADCTRNFSALATSNYTVENKGGLNGNTTYAYVKTVATVNRSAKLNEDGDDIVWDETAGNYGGGATDSDIHKFIYKGENYLANAEEYAKIATAVENRKIEAISGHYVYPNGYVFFPVYLKNQTNDAYEVARNSFINVSITDIKLEAGKFPGYPGGGKGDGGEGEGNPENPQDPTDTGEENNPDPKEEEEEIDPEEASLMVNITVKNWNYYTATTILE